MNTNKIKIEPGNSKLTNIIKIEEGRLPSLVTRNLKLGGTKPKVFRPNLVERKKKNDVIISEATDSGRGRGRGRGRGTDRGRGGFRGRGAQNFIQSHGVFSEGMSEAQRKNTYFSDRSQNNVKDDVSKTMDKPTFNKNVDYKIDKDHEEKVMLQLYDDHIEQEREIVNEIFPINLPTLPQVKDNHKPVFKDQKIVKVKQDPDAATVIIKKEPEVEHFDTIDQMNVPVKSEKYLFDIQEKLLLFQFPDCLPGIGPVIEPEKPQTNSASTENSNEKIEMRGKCTLRDINEGKIGKIVIYKSGKSKLLIGDSVFDIDEGYNPGCLQDVMSVNANTATKTGDMINLGSIEDSVVITPQFDELIKKL